MIEMLWRQIYRFEPACENQEHGDPHLGQIIHYYRKLRRRSHAEIALALDWSVPAMMQCESRPDGPGNPDRLRAIGAFLRIPSFLLDLSDEPEAPEQAWESAPPDPEKVRLLKRMPFLTGSQPMDEEALWLWEHALWRSIKLFDALEPEGYSLEQSSLPFQAQPASLFKMPLGITSSIAQMRLALDNMDYWFSLLRPAAEHTTGARRAQYLYLEQQFTYITSSAIHHAHNLEIDPERWLEYDRRALFCAQELECAELIATALIQRARTFLLQGKDTLALQDIEEALFYIEVDSAVFVGGGESAAFDLRQLLPLAEGRTQTRMLALLDKAMQIAKVTHDTL